MFRTIFPAYGLVELVTDQLPSLPPRPNPIQAETTRHLRAMMLSGTRNDEYSEVKISWFSYKIIGLRRLFALYLSEKPISNLRIGFLLYLKFRANLEAKDIVSRNGLPVAYNHVSRNRISKVIDKAFMTESHHLKQRAAAAEAGLAELFAAAVHPLVVVCSIHACYCFVLTLPFPLHSCAA